MVRYADMAVVLRDVGRRVRELREAKGLTQVVVAAKLEVATQRIQFIESGKANLTLATLIELANALDAPLSEFFPAPVPARPAPRKRKPRRS